MRLAKIIIDEGVVDEIRPGIRVLLPDNIPDEIPVGKNIFNLMGVTGTALKKAGTFRDTLTGIPIFFKPELAVIFISGKKMWELIEMGRRKRLNKKELDENLKKLEDSLILEPDQIDDFITGWKDGLHQYTLRNVLMANTQRWGSFILAGFNEWKRRGRMVFKGQKGLAIFAPNLYRVKKNVENEDDPKYRLRGFRIVYVFDVNQTGVPIDVNYGIGGVRIRFLWDDPDKTIGVVLGGSDKISNNGSLKLVDLINKIKTPVIIEPLPQFANGSTDGNKIWVATNRAETSQIATTIHEYAHVLLEHMNSDLPKQIREIEAEATSYIVCRYFGIENDKSRHYIQAFKGDSEMVAGCGDRVVAVAERIIKELDT